MTDAPMSWEGVLAALARWHDEGDREAGRAAVAFIEVELRLMVPALVRRTWPEDLIEDALHDVLERLVREPLAEVVHHPRRYITRALRNRCIDLYKARRRRQEHSLDDQPHGWEADVDAAESAEEARLRIERAQHVRAAVARLEIGDRVVLKLDHAPEWLNEEEVDWLALRAGVARESMRAEIAAAVDIHALTRLFDPGDDDPDDAELRRKRMERFRRRRARAREKLRVMLQELDP